jgi:hypothetical protein
MPSRPSGLTADFPPATVSVRGIPLPRDNPISKGVRMYGNAVKLRSCPATVTADDRRTMPLARPIRAEKARPVGRRGSQETGPDERRRHEALTERPISGVRHPFRSLRGEPSETRACRASRGNLSRVTRPASLLSPVGLRRGVFCRLLLPAPAPVAGRTGASTASSFL